MLVAKAIQRFLQSRAKRLLGAVSPAIGVQRLGCGRTGHSVLRNDLYNHNQGVELQSQVILPPENVLF